MRIYQIVITNTKTTMTKRFEWEKGNTTSWSNKDLLICGILLLAAGMSLGALITRSCWPMKEYVAIADSDLLAGANRTSGFLDAWPHYSYRGEHIDGSLEEYIRLDATTTCDGISEHYTGTTFYSDWKNMLNYYRTIYQAGGNEPKRIQPPRDMYANNTYDCEDFAHATTCLAAYYATDCSLYFRGEIGEVVPAAGVHVGVCCYIEEENKRLCV
jgi:hypothetical protein